MTSKFATLVAPGRENGLAKFEVFKARGSTVAHKNGLAKDPRAVEFGERLKDFREQRGWSQIHLARSLGVSLRTLCGWERGEHMPSGLAQREIERVMRKPKTKAL